MEMKTWSGAGVCVLVLYTGSSIGDGLVVVWGISVDTTIIHTFFSSPACTDMVYSKELERDVTTTVMAKELKLLKKLASFLHRTSDPV